MSEAFVAPNNRLSYEWACIECDATGVMTQGSLKQSVACCNEWIERGRDRLRVVWDDVHNRCFDPRHPAYPRYAGYEVSGWASYAEFKSWALAQGYRYKDGCDLDRIDNNQGYSPQNCRFVSRKTNSRNRKNSRFLSVGGVTLPLEEWSERTGIQAQTIAARIDRYGWSPEDAVRRDAERSRL